jgi:hypothetical protein
MKKTFSTIELTLAGFVLAASASLADAQSSRIGRTVGPPLIGLSNDTRNERPTRQPAARTAVTIENFSNQPIFVAYAYLDRGFADDLGSKIAHGWKRVERNGRYPFQVEPDRGLCLRIEAEDGGEIEFDNNKTFIHLPVTSAQFRVDKPLDNDSVRILRWGDSLENVFDTTKGGKVPEGWVYRRFFLVKSSANLQILP